jgi:hypothetical protein
VKPPSALTIAVVLTGVVGIAAWGAGAERRFFDYDEIYHAHATWQIAHGLRPFHDFQASHTPFLWYPLAALWRIFPESPATLIPLRFVAALGTLLSVVAMSATFALARREVPAHWWMLGVATVAFDPAILDFGVEFRPDSWSTALLFAGFALLLSGRPAATRRRYACFAALATLATLASPKLTVLPVVFALLDLAGRAYRREDVPDALLGYVAGVVGALLVAFAFLRIAGIDPTLTYDMAIRYQWAVVSNSGFGRGLLGSVMAHGRLLSLVIAGLLAWAAYLARRGRRPTVYEVSLVIFLLAQLMLVDRPYKQYFAPWFLLGACFVPFIGAWATHAVPKATAVIVTGVVVLSGWSAVSSLWLFTRDDQARAMVGYYETLLRAVPSDAPVVAYPPLHPVTRRDAFYAWSRTTDPRGHGTEAIMRSLDVPGYSLRFAPAYYREELETRPPALVVAPRDANWAYEPNQWAVLQEYLATHQDEFVLVDRRGLPSFWIRRHLVDDLTPQPSTGVPH